MSDILLTSDFHFDHDDIIKYCHRPFSNTEDMNDLLIENYNSKATDKTYGIIAGDIIFGGTKHNIIKEFMGRLKGKKLCVIGNHDHALYPLLKWSTKDIKALTGLEDVVQAHDFRYKFKDGEIKEFMVYHYPQVTWNKKRYGSIHCFGHVHNGIVKPIPGSLDIGVDANNYYPLSPEDIRTIMIDKHQWVTSAPEL